MVDTTKAMAPMVLVLKQTCQLLLQMLLNLCQLSPSRSWQTLWQRCAAHSVTFDLSVKPLQVPTACLHNHKVLCIYSKLVIIITLSFLTTESPFMYTSFPMIYA